MPTLLTPRLRLRPVDVEADLAGLHAALSDPEAMAYWSTPPHGDIGETRAWLELMAEIPPAEGEDFVIEHAGRAIGKAGLYRFPEIGFILRRAYWGQGFAREALEAVLTRAFGVHRLPEVTADVDPRNEASLKLLARLGFRETGRAAGTWVIGGIACDSVYLALSPGDWAALRSDPPP